MWKSRVKMGDHKGVKIHENMSENLVKMSAKSNKNKNCGKKCR